MGENRKIFLLPCIKTFCLYIFVCFSNIITKMKIKTIILFFFLLAAFVSCSNEDGEINSPNIPQHDIVIMYENDVHCAVDGYAKFAALRSEYEEVTPYVTTVSSGDFVMGEIVGSSTMGEAVIQIMNKVGYDYVTLGNHEFDYGIERMNYLLSDCLNATVVDANFCRYPSMELVFSPYAIQQYGDVKVAYLGLTTPNALTASTPTLFVDENGNRKYSFMDDTLTEQTNRMAEQARSEGADYVVVLAHMGDNLNTGVQTSIDIIHNTRGIDVVLDGHAHSAINDTLIANADGQMVHLTSTGTKFQHMGVLTIDTEGGISAKLYDTSAYEKVDAEVQQYVEDIKSKVAEAGNYVIGHTDFTLSIYDEQGKRVVRNKECGLGNFFADAFRYMCNTDVAFTNGGNLRESIQAGDITYNNIFNVIPFGNTLCTATMTGQQLLDALEFCYSELPNEVGRFLHISGMRLCIDTSVQPVFEMQDGMFVAIADDSPRRVHNLEIMNSNSGQYEPVDLAKTYSVASSDYLLKNLGGEGAFRYAALDADLMTPDVDIIIQYFREVLGGKVPDMYQSSEGRISMK